MSIVSGLASVNRNRCKVPLYAAISKNAPLVYVTYTRDPGGWKGT
jgi:hypothetical protein